ncbi:MAG: flagellar biosynthesis protein FlhB [Capsulimonadaceae bacterium]|nr:flagellar biosynthesis protein FlhB [Capsulimonadaceae bacterium]
MSEDSSGEKVFPATDRKRKEARKKGQVARSMELSAAFVMLTLIAWLRFSLTTGQGVNDLFGAFQTAFRFNPHPDALTIRSTTDILREATIWSLRLMLPGMLIAMAIGFLVNVFQVGFSFSWEALAPKFDKVNPLTGMKRMLSRHGAVESFKGTAKIAIIGWMSYSLVMDRFPLLISAAQQDLVSFLSAIGNLLWAIALRATSFLIVLAIADYAYQRFEFEKNLKMTHTEMKQELKQSEGDPLIKQRIRQTQKSMSQKRMMQRVPSATVVITNPTHFAVALQYEAGAMTAPIVVAKGQDFIAQQIKKIALEADVPMVENVALARLLYKEVEIGREVPPHLYKAIAEVLAFVYRTYRKRYPGGVAA